MDGWMGGWILTFITNMFHVKKSRGIRSHYKTTILGHGMKLREQTSKIWNHHVIREAEITNCLGTPTFLIGTVCSHFPSSAS